MTDTITRFRIFFVSFPTLMFVRRAINRVNQANALDNLIRGSLAWEDICRLSGRLPRSILEVDRFCLGRKWSPRTVANSLNDVCGGGTYCYRHIFGIKLSYPSPSFSVTVWPRSLPLSSCCGLGWSSIQPARSLLHLIEDKARKKETSP